MNSDQSTSFAELLARYKQLLEVDHSGPPNPARRAQLQALADQLRHQYPSQLAAEASKHLQKADSMLKTVGDKHFTPHGVGSSQPQSGSTTPSTPTVPPEGVQYINPKLGDKLKEDLMGRVQDKGR